MKSHPQALENPFQSSEGKFLILCEQLSQDKIMTLSEIEVLLQKQGPELLRQMIQDRLDLVSTREVSAQAAIGPDKIKRKAKRRQSRQIETLFGTVVLNRLGYGKAGVPSVHPLDSELNLPLSKYTYALQKMVCAEAALRSYDEAGEQLSEVLAGYIPKRQAEEAMQSASIDFMPFYDQPFEAVQEDILVLSFDGKGVVMRTEDLLVKPSQKQRKNPFAKEKCNRKRMATVSAIYEIGRYPRTPSMVAKSLYPSDQREFRPRAQNKQVYASLKTPMKQVIAEVFAQAKHRDPAHKKEWVVLVDGNRAQLKYVKGQAKAMGRKVSIIVDLMHVLEYLWKAAQALHGKGSEKAERWVGDKLLRILQGKSALMAAAMRRSATNQGLNGSAREAVDKCAQYLLNQKPYLRYDQYLSKGYPIATGVIEGACRYLVKDRMDRTGARWSLLGAEAVLKMRALKINGDFDAYWQFHEEQQCQRNYGGLRKVFSGVKLKQKRVSNQDYKRDEAA